MKNIVLIGYRCTGKSSVGRTLAKELHRAFLDTDAMVEERTGRSISDIVRQDGWPRFREIERQIVQDAASLHHAVISTGGGVVTDEQNRQALKRNGWLVWLRAGAEIIKSRMQGDKTRPSLAGDDAIKEVDEVLMLRTSLYEKTADDAVDTDHLSTEQVAESVLRRLPAEEA